MAAASPFLSSFFPRPSFRNPLDPHLQISPVRQTRNRQKLGLIVAQSELRVGTWVWQKDVTVIQRFTVVHLLFVLLFTITPIWVPALRGTQLLQPRFSVTSSRRAASPLIRQPKSQHSFLQVSCALHELDFLLPSNTAFETHFSYYFKICFA